MQVRRSLVVNRNKVGAGVGIPVNGFFGIRNHHVHIEWHVAYALGNTYDLGSKGKVGRKVAIHDIDMNEIGV